MCTVTGCSKHYTMPSSLRRHVRTAHGPESYVKKEHNEDGTCKRKQSAVNQVKKCFINKKHDNVKSSFKGIFSRGGLDWFINYE